MHESKVKGQGKLNRHIIYDRVRMLLAKIIKISLCLSKLQLVKVGAFFETHGRLKDNYQNISTTLKGWQMIATEGWIAWRHVKVQKNRVTSHLLRGRSVVLCTTCFFIRLKFSLTCRDSHGVADLLDCLRRKSLTCASGRQPTVIAHQEQELLASCES